MTAMTIPAMAPTGKLWELWPVDLVIVEPPFPVGDVEPAIPLDSAMAIMCAGSLVKVVCEMEKFLFP